ncbi:MAG: hypothetical protein ACLPHI_04840 [Terriglobales bacterium]|jgi:hypothetical protein
MTVAAGYAKTWLEARMAKSGKKSFLESIPMLVLLGLLAGAIGGLGVGLIQLRALTSSASSSTGK